MLNHITTSILWIINLTCRIIVRIRRRSKRGIRRVRIIRRGRRRKRRRRRRRRRRTRTRRRRRRGRRRRRRRRIRIKK